MRRAVPRVVRYRASETSKFVVEGLRINGKRTRRFFSTRRSAATWLRQTLARIKKEGESTISTPEGLRSEAIACAAKLAPYGKTLTDATKHLLAHLAAVERTCTFTELQAEFLKHKRIDGAAEMYLKDLKNRCDRFAEKFGQRKVAELRGPEIDDWLRDLGVAPQTRNNFRTVLRTLFSYAVDRSYAPENPMEKTAKAKVIRGAPTVLTPAQMKKLLEVAPKDFIPYLTIGGFAGLRSAEIERLDWSEVDISGRLIEVKAEKSKTAQRRLVTISENLAAWLAPLAQKSGPVANMERARVARAQTIKAAGMSKWPENALRHSAASYHLGHYKNAPATATELGHTSPVMLYRHYRDVVKPEIAAQWWQIMPPEVCNG